MKQIGLILEEDTHHLDHLAPLCLLLGIPLATNSDQIRGLCHTFYPRLNLIYRLGEALPLFLLDHYDVILSSITRPLLSLFFFPHEDLMSKTLHTLWCPHGYSDKGKTVPFFEALHQEETLLYYGAKMLKTLEEKVENLASKRLVCVGNYRQQYYEQQATFYSTLIKNYLPFEKPEQTTLLYAPTWQDSENASSSDTLLPLILKHLPAHLNLILKLHPNTLKTCSDSLQSSLERIKNKPNIVCAHHVPTIWPLLEQSDLFLGDMSSIGYDYLYFNKPMFFLPHPQCKLSKTSPLTKCGLMLTPSKLPDFFNNLEDYIKQALPLEKENASIYSEVFSTPNLNPLKNEALL